MIQLLWKIVWQLLKILNIELPCVHVSQIASVVSNSVQLYGLQPARLLSPWDSPGKNNGMGCQALLQGIFPTWGSNPHLLCLTFTGRWILYYQHHLGRPEATMLLLLSHFSRVQLCATSQTAAHQAPLSLGFSRQEHWSGLPFPSPMQESEK